MKYFVFALRFLWATVRSRLEGTEGVRFRFPRLYLPRVSLCFLRQLCTYQCNAGEGGGRAWGGDLTVFVVPGVGHLTDLVLPGEGIFESFFTRHGDI